MLLFFDIDGTLIDSRHCLPPSVRPAMEAARRKGHRMVINTGRTLCNMDRRLDELPLDGWIMGCGTRIIWHGETLQSMEYSPADSLRLRQVFLQLGIPVVYECDTAMYFDPEAPDWPEIVHFREFARRRGIDREVGAEDPEFRAVKMFCFAEDPAVIRRLERRTAEIGMPYGSIRRGEAAWEIVPEGYTKGTGIDVLRKKLGAPLSDCWAFGDSTNDLTMLRHVPHSVAMGNAPEEVKKICTYVTDLPEEDGIARALERLGLTV